MRYIPSPPLQVTIESEAGPGETRPRTTHALLPVTVALVRTPPRHRRLLWDQFHSVPYPPAYSPRDYLGVCVCVCFCLLLLLFSYVARAIESAYHKI